METIKKTRTFTVSFVPEGTSQCFYGPNAKDYPMIKFGGKWLKECGFLYHDIVELIPGDRELVIRFKERPEPKSFVW